MSRNWMTDAGLLAIRLMLGIVFVYHGGQKLFGLFGGPGLDGFAGFLGQIGVPAPGVSALLAALAEFGGGVLLITGVAMRWAMIPLAFTMLVAAFTVHGDAFAASNNGMEFPLTLGVVAIGLALTGPGRWTLLALLPGRDLAGRNERDLRTESASA